MQSLFYNGGLIGTTLDFGNTEFYQIPLAGAGEQVYTTPGTYSWTAPAGVTSVCVVAVGGGGGGLSGNGNGGNGGSGGGLGWKNNITVTPGNSYTVVVGAGGTRLTSTTAGAAAGNGGNSYFINTSTVAGFGGLGGLYASSSTRAGGSYVGDGGGSGGSVINSTSTTDATGGGGAGGYTGNGGNGASIDSAGSSGSGGGGGGGGAGGTSDAAGAGGGVGLYGQGASGVGGAYTASDAGPGGGGSNGQPGSDSPGSTARPSTGGAFGGGGGGSELSNENGPGASGAVRIIWGQGRSFPTTNVSANPLGNGNQKNSGIWLLQSVFETLLVPSSPITDGLILQLDAGISTSYPGSGTTWTDLSGSNNGTLVGNITYSSLNGGGLVFDGTDDYISLGTINTNLSNNTFMFQVSASVVNKINTLIAGAGNGYYQIRFNAVNNIALLDSNIVSMGSFTGFTATANTVYNITVTRSGTTYTLYVDGVFIGQITSAETFTTTSPRLGANILLEELTGTMYCVYFYNRTLTPEEVMHNYRFINSRF